MRRWPLRLGILSIVFVSVAARAQSLRITSGVTDEQVFQRGEDERADISFSGEAERANGKYIEARLLSKTGPVTGFDWKALERVQRGRFGGTMKGIPTGGPYRLEVRIAGTNTNFTINNLMVGDLWLLAGQSNMQGVGDLVDVQPSLDLVHSFDMTDRWLVAEEPLHTLPSALDRVHWPLNEKKEPERYAGEKLAQYLANRKKGSGLGLPFAVQMVQRTGVPIGLVPCAHGGTSMDQWDPSLKDKAGESLYGSMLRRVRAVGGRVRGVLWYQGESDANPKAAPDFLKKFERFVTSTRDDFGQPALPFYYVQIGRHVATGGIAEWNLVQDMQRRAEMTIPRVTMVVSIDSQLDDGIHVSTADLKRIGARIADLACHDLFPSLKQYAQLRRGPRPDSAKVEGNTVKLKFVEVNGKLLSDARVAGFSIHAANGDYLPLVFRTRLDPGDPAGVILHFQGKLPEGANVRYGFGRDPYCNVRDEADMSVPVFGPLAIQ